MSEPACLQDHELLPLVSGEAIANGLQVHVNGCASCQERLERLRAEVRVLRETVQGVQAGLTGEWAGAVSTVNGKSPPAVEQQPAAIGKYVIVDALDEGGQALVYRVVHPTLGKELVLKIARRPADSSQTSVGLASEGKLLADLDHPNLARVYDLDCHDGRPFLVMEYIRGQNLQQLARQQGWTPEQAAILVARLARALAVAHRRGVIHQDLKPSNILIDESGQPRIIDFGLARFRSGWVEDAPDSGDVSGTPAYMAPEQARGETAKVDARSDVFGLGGVLFFLLTNQPPFVGQTVRETLTKASRCELDLSALESRNIPHGLIAVCIKALAADPARRYVRASDLADALERFAGRRRRLAVLSFAVVLLVLLAVGAAWLIRHSQQSPEPGFPPTPQYLVTMVQRQERVLDDLRGAIPLRTGDRLQLGCYLPRGVRPSLFWFDTGGKWTLLEPIEVTRGEVWDELRYPPRGWVPLVGAPGTEFLLICGSRAGPADREQLAKLLETGRPWPTLPPQVLVLMSRDRTELALPRGVGAPEADALSEVQGRIDELRLKLREQFEFIAGVAFCHQR